MNSHGSVFPVVAINSNISKAQIPYIQAMEHLVEVVQALSLARALDQIMVIVRRAARELTGADGASFVLRDGEQCYYADEDAIAPLWKGQRFPMNICISGYTMRHRQPVVIGDIYEDERIPFAAYRPTFVKSLATVPIRTCAPIGVIGVYWATRHEPTVEEVKLLQALADTTAVAMENVQIYSELEQRVRSRTAVLEEEIEKRQKAEAKVIQISLTDELTGLYNRRGFFLLAGQQLKLAHRLKTPCCLVFTDLDGLKKINDTLGHKVGDRAIADAAELLRQTFRDSDIVARLGGDEFVVFITECLGHTDKIADRLQANVAFLNQHQDRSYQLSMSIGIQQCFVDENLSLEQLVSYTDQLMYQHKLSKRGLNLS